MTGRFVWLKTSPQRIETMMRDIEIGSEPRFAFYALLFVASMIATIGLIANSTAVIIGAMLVSPLMTPIFGIALAMLLGDSRLFWRALTAEVLGVIIAIGIAAVLGLLPLAIEATPEMLARTKPNLLDLMVAVFAGFAGTFAVIDERVSPALPGVAIATAIVPPLSNTGLCLSLGAYSGALGSFTLFVANFFAILLVGAATFAAAGVLKLNARLKQRELARNFLFAMVGFIVVSTLLTQSLILMVKNRKQERIISNVVTNRLSQLDLPPFKVEDIFHHQFNDRVEVVIELLSSEILSPKQVDVLQHALVEKLNMPTELVVRTLPAYDIAPTGSNAQIARPNLDGRLISSDLSEWEMNERIAEQYLYEELSGRLGLEIESINFTDFEDYPNILVALRSAVPFSVEEIRDLQDGLSKRLSEPELYLAIQSVDSTVYTDVGKYLVEWSNPDTVMDIELLKKLKSIVREEMTRQPNLFVNDVYVKVEDETWNVLIEIVGPFAPVPDQIAALQDLVANRFPHPVTVYARFMIDTIITPDGYSGYREFTEETRKRSIKRIPEIFRKSRPEVVHGTQ